MNKTGYLLAFVDTSDYEYQPITVLAFSLNREELEAELEILEKNYHDRLENFEDQSDNCDAYIKSFESSWKEYEQSFVIPFYIPTVPQTVTKLQKTREEHAEYKRIKDLNTENAIINKNFQFTEKSEYLLTWTSENPPGESFKNLIELEKEMNLKIPVNLKKLEYAELSYFISEVGDVVKEKY